MPSMMKLWKSVSARQMMKKMELLAPIWQPEYFDRFLRSAESYSEKWAYVELNPVRAKLVERPEQWPYKGRVYELRF